MESPFESFSSERILSRLDALAEKEGQSIAIWSSRESISFSELRSELESRAHGLRSTLDAGGLSHLPLEVGMSLASHLDILSCFVFGVPFCLIDETFPNARKQQIVDLLLPQKAVAKELKPKLEESDREEVLVEDLTPGTSYSPSPSPSLVITTSGSTGRPKGVEISFDSTIKRMEYPDLEISRMPFTIASLVPPHFAGGLNRLLRVLLGNRLVVLDPKALSMRELMGQIRSHGVHSLSLPPQITRLMADYQNRDRFFFESVELLRIGSEGIRFETLAKLKHYFPATTMVRHGLGMTEAAQAFVHFFRLADIPDTGRVPIGEPTHDTMLLPREDLGEDLFEVAVKGPIAERYLGDTQLNEKRFFAASDGTRFWLSGDIVELRSGNTFFHFARIDDLIKVRGILASPAETTSALLEIEGVLNAVTMPHEQDGNTRLVAHVVASPDHVLSTAKIRTLLGEKLPAHLIPSEVYFHASFPITPRGKVDRQSLEAFGRRIGSDAQGKT